MEESLRHHKPDTDWEFIDRTAGGQVRMWRYSYTPPRWMLLVIWYPAQKPFTPVIRCNICPDDWGD